ncbi:hypothetical protein QCA50_012139 [Cerrena zonata]|uniref:Uncharacterized protein n=1 Tax=Cerrena zonata TaxID=2478898 RepID=A0AAW0G196_9APHY
MISNLVTIPPDLNKEEIEKDSPLFSAANFRNLKKATPQKTNPNQQSKSEHMRESKSEKKGITSAKIKATIHKIALRPIQVDQPVTILKNKN